MDDMIIYVPTRIVRVGNQCRLVPIQGPGCAKRGDNYQTLDRINPDLVYSRSRFPSNIFKGTYLDFYDKAIELGHTHNEAIAHINKYMTYSSFKFPPMPPLLSSDSTFYETSDALMDDAFHAYVSRG